MTNTSAFKTGIFRALAGVSLLCAQSALAITQGDAAVTVYQLHNHPAGTAAAPFYGLRLDDLLGSGEYTFDFDAADNGAGMFLETDGSTFIHIYGQAWGGLDGGTEYVDPGLWSIDMTYSLVGTLDNGGAVDLTGDGGSGTIGNDSLTFYLTSYAGDFSNAFFFGDEDGSGHRDAPGLNGWGWLTYSTDPNQTGDYASSSDFLFTATPVPLPAAFWLLCSALMGLGFVRREGEF